MSSKYPLKVIFFATGGEYLPLQANNIKSFGLQKIFKFHSNKIRAKVCIRPYSSIKEKRGLLAPMKKGN
jgi:hypothetical protein